MIYGKIFPDPTKIGLTKSTICDFSGIQLSRDAVRLIHDFRLIKSLTFLEDRYFHVKRQLDEGSLYASKVEALEKAAKSHESVETRILAQHYIENAISFASNAPDCFRRNENDKMFDEITICTETVLLAAEIDEKGAELARIREIFDGCKNQKNEIDSKLAAALGSGPQ